MAQGSIDSHASVLWHLARLAPLVLAVHSGDIPPTANLQFYGEVKIDARTTAMRLFSRASPTQRLRKHSKFFTDPSASSPSS